MLNHTGKAKMTGSAQWNSCPAMTREIARELNLKENKVKKSLLRIYDKLGVSNRVELVLYALSPWQARPPECVREEQPV